MLRTYKYNGKMWRYHEGQQPAGAVLVEFSKPEKKETPEERAAKAPEKRKASKKGE